MSDKQQISDIQNQIELIRQSIRIKTEALNELLIKEAKLVIGADVGSYVTDCCGGKRWQVAYKVSRFAAEHGSVVVVYGYRKLANGRYSTKESPIDQWYFYRAITEVEAGLVPRADVKEQIDKENRQLVKKIMESPDEHH